LSASGALPAQRARLQMPHLLGERRPRTINMSTIGDALLHEGGNGFGPRVDAIVVYNSNPVAVAPESAKVVAGFARENLFTVVLEQFMTDTADLADYVLPATTQIEHWDIHGSYGHTDVLLNRPAIAPLGQARSNGQIFRDLAAHMARHDDAFAAAHFQTGDEQLCREAFEGRGVDFNELLDKGFATLALPEAPFAEGGFPTPSGRCEFTSAELARRGMDPLPDYLPNYETAETDARYPLAMISPPARNFLNSSFVNVKSLRTMEGRPLVELHPDDAATRGVAEGDRVRVFNDRGSYECHATLNGRARRGVVNGLGIWWRKHGDNGTNVNELTHQRLTDLGRAPSFYDCAVQVQRLA
ncbi:molybdopterin-dependent oxidoreductase, partial [Delftia sp. BR1]